MWFYGTILSGMRGTGRFTFEILRVLWFNLRWFSTPNKRNAMSCLQGEEGNSDESNVPGFDPFYKDMWGMRRNRSGNY